MRELIESLLQRLGLVGHKAARARRTAVRAEYQVRKLWTRVRAQDRTIAELGQKIADLQEAIEELRAGTPERLPAATLTPGDFAPERAGYAAQILAAIEADLLAEAEREAALWWLRGGTPSGFKRTGRGASAWYRMAHKLGIGEVRH